MFGGVIGCNLTAKNIDEIRIQRSLHEHSHPANLAVRWFVCLLRSEFVRAGVDVAKEAREFLPRDLRADGFSNTAYNLNVDLGHIEAYAKLAELIVGLPENAMTKPLDGRSLKPLFAKELRERRTPIGFRYQAERALIDDRFKLLTDNLTGGKFELYDLIADPKESRDLSAEQPEIFARMKQQLLDWNAGMNASFAGKDYPEGRVTPPDPEPVNWFETPQYQPFLTEWKKRWEFQSYLSRAATPKTNSKTKKVGKSG